MNLRKKELDWPLVSLKATWLTVKKSKDEFEKKKNKIDIKKSQSDSQFSMSLKLNRVRVVLIYFSWLD